MTNANDSRWLGELIQQLRKTVKVSQTKLGEILELHQTAVCRVESGNQKLSPEQLFSLARFFGIGLDDLQSGKIDYWRVADRFGMAPPLPARYTELPFSKVREALPFIGFTKTVLGSGFTRKLFTELKTNEEFLLHPDMKLGVHFSLDWMRELIKKGVLKKSSLSKLIEQARSEDSQGFLHQVYSTQTNPLSLVQAWVVNSHHYDVNFEYNIERLSNKAMDLSIAPAVHMADVPYKDEVLGDFVCEYKKSYLRHFPLYIGKKTVEVAETECHFHGSDRCLYQLKIA